MDKAAILILLGSLYVATATGCVPMAEYRGPEDSAPVALGGGRRGTNMRFPGAPAQVITMSLGEMSSTGSDDFLMGDPTVLGFLSVEQDPGRMMVYSAAMGLEVARVEEAIARCLEMVNEVGGYLSQRANSTLTCRMPAARFDGFLEDLRAYGRVLHESMQAREVTRQHVDLSIRLDNARRSRERLLALLERAEAVEDLLKIEQELRRLTEEIERMEGELKYLDDQVAMSTVAVTFQPVAAPGTPDGPRRRSRFTWINMTGAEYVLRWF